MYALEKDDRAEMESSSSELEMRFALLSMLEDIPCRLPLAEFESSLLAFCEEEVAESCSKDEVRDFASLCRARSLSSDISRKEGVEVLLPPSLFMASATTSVMLLLRCSQRQVYFFLVKA